MFIFSKKMMKNYSLYQIRLTGRSTLMMLFMVANGGTYADVGSNCGERLTITNMPPKTSICLRKTDYCTVTNAVALIEKIIERRCLMMTLWLKWGFSSNSVDAAKNANLSEEHFENDMRRWLTDVATYPDETISLLKDELGKENELIENLKKSRVTMSYADYIERLTDEQRHRFMTRLYYYKAKLYSTLATQFF